MHFRASGSQRKIIKSKAASVEHMKPGIRSENGPKREERPESGKDMSIKERALKRAFFVLYELAS